MNPGLEGDQEKDGVIAWTQDWNRYTHTNLPCDGVQLAGGAVNPAGVDDGDVASCLILGDKYIYAFGKCEVASRGQAWAPNRFC